MKIKMLTSCAGEKFAYTKGDEIEVSDKIAKDLIKAKYAVEVKANGAKAGK
jgi:hypothetical protein